MIYIGLDLATKKTGCCIMDSSGHLIHYELIRANKKQKDFKKRIEEIGNKIEDIILAYKPDIIAVEEPPIIKNSSASMLLIMHGYFLKISRLYSLDIKVFEPCHWRSVLGIIGKNGKEALKKDAVKQSTVEYINKKYSTNFVYIKDSEDSTDDIADSIGVALCAIKEEEQ